MSTSTVVAFILLLSLADSAPLPSDPASLLASPQMWLRAQAVVQKILLSLPQLHAKTVSASQLSYEGPAHQLHLMASQLQVPTPPLLQPLSATFTAGDSVRRVWEGLVQQQRIVGDLSTRLSVLGDLHADLQDLGSQVATMMSLMGVVQPTPVQSESSILSRLSGDFELQVAAHLTLTTVREFCQDVRRSLRALETHTQSGNV